MAVVHARTSHTGYLTAESFFDVVNGDARLGLYNQYFQLVTTSSSTFEGQRLDYRVAAGATYYLGLIGDNSAVSLRMVNLVQPSADGLTVTVYGTDKGDDTFSFVYGATRSLVVDGATYSFSLFPNVATVLFYGEDGLADETYATTDTVFIDDSPDNDTFTGSATSCSMVSTTFAVRAYGFEIVHAYSVAGGTDTASLYDSAANDVFVGTPTQSWMKYSGSFSTFIRVKYFPSVVAYSTTGSDSALLYDSAGTDTFIATVSYAELSGDGYLLQARKFAAAAAYATPGAGDTAFLYDSSGNDTLTADSSTATMTTSAATFTAGDFDYVHAYAPSGGYDEAYLYDSTFNDRLESTAAYNKLYFGDRAEHFVRAKQFDVCHTYATAGGYDMANLTGSGGADSLDSTPVYTRLSGSGFFNRVKYFDEVYVTGSAASSAHLRGDEGDNYLEAAGSDLYFANSSVQLWLYNFGSVVATPASNSTNTKHVEAIDFLLETQGYWIDV